jgi:uncharacterized protein
MRAKSAVLLLSGLLFGGGLALSGMTDPRRVIGFLDVTGAWDPSLAFVMAGALVVFAVGLRLWRRKHGVQGLFGTIVPELAADPIDARLLFGAVIFGLGWGISGFCPGPALANLSALRTGVVVFVLAMAVGVLAAQRGFGSDRELEARSN